MIRIRNAALMAHLPFEVVAELPDSAYRDLVRRINDEDRWILFWKD